MPRLSDRTVSLEAMRAAIGDCREIFGGKVVDGPGLRDVRPAVPVRRHRGRTWLRDFALLLLLIFGTWIVGLAAILLPALRR